MAVKISSRTAWLWSLTLAFTLGEAHLVRADEVVASDSEATSTFFITDDSVDAAPSPAKSVAGTLVMIEDDSKAVVGKVVAATKVNSKSLPTFVQPQKSTSRGDLTVIPHGQSRPSLNALRSAAEQPLAGTAASRAEASLKLVSPGASSENRSVTVQPAHMPVVHQAQGSLQIIAQDAVNISDKSMPTLEVATVEPRVVAPTSADISETDELLVIAHLLSQQASKASEYTEIVQHCSEAQRLGLAKDQQQFARQLSSWALNRRGQMRSDEGEQDLAIADFEAALEYNPRNWRAMHNRGVSYAQSGQLAEAFDDFNATIQLNPTFGKAFANRATLYVQAKDLQAATKDYERATQCDSTLVTAYVGLGRVCHQLGRLDKAIEYFSTAMKLAPANAGIVCSRGDLQADMGRYGEALDDYARTIELDPEFAHAYRNGAWLLATCPDEQFRDTENAVLGARQALDYSYGEQHVALDTLAAALANAGQYEEAIATASKAVDLAPENTKHTYLARLELYQSNQPFRTEPVGEVSQATFEVSDQ